MNRTQRRARDLEAAGLTPDAAARDRTTCPMSSTTPGPTKRRATRSPGSRRSTPSWSRPDEAASRPLPRTARSGRSSPGHQSLAPQPGPRPLPCWRVLRREAAARPPPDRTHNPAADPLNPPSPPTPLPTIAQTPDPQPHAPAPPPASAHARPTPSPARTTPPRPLTHTAHPPHRPKGGRRGGVRLGMSAHRRAPRPTSGRTLGSFDCAKAR